MDDIDRAIKFLRSHFELGIYTKRSESIIALLKQGKKLIKENEELRKYKEKWEDERSMYVN